jgi:hypothetical protein
LLVAGYLLLVKGEGQGAESESIDLPITEYRIPVPDCQLDLIHQMFNSFSAFGTVYPDTDLSIYDVSPHAGVIAVHDNRESCFACHGRIKRVSVRMAAQDRSIPESLRTEAMSRQGEGCRAIANTGRHMKNTTFLTVCLKDRDLTASFSHSACSILKASKSARLLYSMSESGLSSPHSSNTKDIPTLKILYGFPPEPENSS